MNAKQEAKKCDFVPYGIEEYRCKKCGYVIWRDEEKTFDEIVEDMFAMDYHKPKCYSIEIQKP